MKKISGLLYVGFAVVILGIILLFLLSNRADVAYGNRIQGGGCPDFYSLEKKGLANITSAKEAIHLLRPNEENQISKLTFQTIHVIGFSPTSETNVSAWTFDLDAIDMAGNVYTHVRCG